MERILPLRSSSDESYSPSNLVNRINTVLLESLIAKSVPAMVVILSLTSVLIIGSMLSLPLEQLKDFSFLDTQAKIFDLVLSLTLALPINLRAAVTCAQSGTGMLLFGPQKDEPFNSFLLAEESFASVRSTPVSVVIASNSISSSE